MGTTSFLSFSRELDDANRFVIREKNKMREAVIEKSAIQINEVCHFLDLKTVITSFVCLKARSITQTIPIVIR
jgi:hypothetical protein